MGDASDGTSRCGEWGSGPAYPSPEVAGCSVERWRGPPTASPTAQRSVRLPVGPPNSGPGPRGRSRLPGRRRPPPAPEGRRLRPNRRRRPKIADPAWAAATGEADAWHDDADGHPGWTARARSGPPPGTRATGGTRAVAAGAAAGTAPRRGLGTRIRTGRGGEVGAGGAAGAVPAERSLRNRILPRSVLGIAVLILAFAIGAGFSGVVLFSYYQYKLNQTNDRVNSLISGYKKDFTNAEGNLNATIGSAKASIQNDLQNAQQQVASPATIAALVKSLAPSVFFVHTLDANGQPSVGTAFVVASNATQSLLLTSYTTVAAATKSPGPLVYVRQGNTDTQVTVHTWDPQYDLALIVLPQGGLKPVPPAPPRRRRSRATGSSPSRDWVRRAPPSTRAPWSTCPPAAWPRTPPSARHSRAHRSLTPRAR